MKKATLFGFVVALSMIGGVNLDPLTLGAAPANAVVYCKTAGVPRGCVVRPAGAAVARPVATRPVVYCKTVGVPKGCVMR
jgi:hypothetical protein